MGVDWDKMKKEGMKKAEANKRRVETPLTKKTKNKMKLNPADKRKQGCVSYNAKDMPSMPKKSKSKCGKLDCKCK
tara:strand:+ start:98 stop:322 length:225 start_codon:yes stop_codon:yes gene_type:complete